MTISKKLAVSAVGPVFALAASSSARIILHESLRIRSADRQR